MSINLYYKMLKKKGRKPKSYYENLKLLEISNNNLDSDNISDVSINNLPKKRGRKPKGGKIIEEKKNTIFNTTIYNIIVHLKCNIKDIYDNNEYKYNPDINIINNYNINDNTSLNYDYIDNNKSNNISKELNNVNNFDNTNNTKFIYINNENEENNENNENNINKNTNISNNEINDEINNEIKNEIINKNLFKKLKQLNFNNSNYNINSNAACFWCTCNFSNENIYIPKYELNNIFYCYGNFCTPQCACAYLMNENIDTTTKFERYYLLNNIYTKIFNYKNNIKLAPNPFYLLDKYYGNLTIEEYRKLLNNEKIIYIANKPVTKIFPEVYEENIDFLINSKIGKKIKK